MQLRTDGTPSTKAAISTIWGPKALEHLVELDLKFTVKIDKAARRLSSEYVSLFPLSYTCLPTRTSCSEENDTQVHVRGLISRFAVGYGRASSDRQFFFVNGRPCNPGKVFSYYHVGLLLVPTRSLLRYRRRSTKYTRLSMQTKPHS